MTKPKRQEMIVRYEPGWDSMDYLTARAEGRIQGRVDGKPDDGSYGDYYASYEEPNDAKTKH